jgi:hypothetical protein
MANSIKEQGGCYVVTEASSTAVRICQSARDRNIDIAGAKFSTSGEPLTEVKKREIESVGASVYPHYIFTEGGYVGFACFNPIAADEVHFFNDSLAMIQHPKVVSDSGVSVDSFLFTSLLFSAPKVLLNVEIGDYGIVERRNCGCYFDELGLNEHIYNIRSFDRLTSQGMTFFSTDLVRVIEEVLPAKFGGSSIDYQMWEEEEEGITRMSIIVSPVVGVVNEAEVIRTVLAELGKGKDYKRLMSKIWSQSDTLRVNVTWSATNATDIIPNEYCRI